MDIFVWLISVMIFVLVIAFWILFRKLENIEKRIEIEEKSNDKDFIRVYKILNKILNLTFEDMDAELAEDPKQTVLRKTHFTGKQRTDNHRENSKNEDTV